MKKPLLAILAYAALYLWFLPNSGQAATATWTFCATEGNTCTYGGAGEQRTIRYGAGGRYVVKRSTGGVITCSAASFGGSPTTAAKSCWYSSVNTGTAPPGSGVPNPSTIAGKPIVGFISASNNQVISNVHVTTTSGPCIDLVNVTGVIIQDSEIGPCGSPSDTGAVGIRTINTNNATIRRNVIHDVATGLYYTDSQNPLVFEKNFLYNIRGPFPRGQIIQSNGFSGGSGQSRINCNVSDGLPGTRYGVQFNYNNIEDHINLFETQGFANAPIEIAYNYLRGGSPTSNSGTGILVGDGQTVSGYSNVHDNVITNVRSVGMQVASGHDHVFNNNRIYMNDAVINADIGIYNHNYSSTIACTNNTVTNNRISITGQALALNDGSCTNTTVSGNNEADGTLSAAMFDEVKPAACQ